MGLKLNTASSGSVTLEPANTASNYTLTVPAQTGTIATLTTPSFTSTIGVGGATPASSGAGITFPSTQSDSSNANTLDDYEEGTWTPTLTNFSGSVSSGFITKYTKIGNLVTVTGVIVTTSGTISGSGMAISGFPFASGSQYTSGVIQGSFGSTVVGNFRLPPSSLSTEALTSSSSTSAISGTGVLNISICITYQIA